MDGWPWILDEYGNARGRQADFLLLSKEKLCFMLNQRMGNPAKPEDYEGIRLYWSPMDIGETRERLKSLGYDVSELEDRDYGQNDFFS